MEIIIFLLFVYIAIKFFSIFVKVKISDPDEGPDEFKNAEEQKVIVCKTETHNNIIYVWEKTTDTFLTQGNSMEEVVQFFVKNYPNTRILFEK